MQRLSISKGHAFILVFSVTSRQSLEELKTILETVGEVKGGDLTGIPVMLVGNKCDEETGKREVNKKTGEALQVRRGNIREADASKVARQHH